MPDARLPRLLANHSTGDEVIELVSGARPESTSYEATSRVDK
jgi:hypothetical protein